MDDVHGREVTGGSFPAEIWAKFMRVATDELEAGGFRTPESFPGRELNAELELPTSSTSSTESTTSTTEDDGSTTTEDDSNTTTSSTPEPTVSVTTTPSTTSSTRGPILN
jgi:membrane carboxypeptidase/penicillin-binding protein